MSPRLCWALKRSISLISLPCLHIWWLWTWYRCFTTLLPVHCLTLYSPQPGRPDATFLGSLSAEEGAPKACRYRKDTSAIQLEVRDRTASRQSSTSSLTSSPSTPLPCRPSMASWSTNSWSFIFSALPRTCLLFLNMGISGIFRIAFQMLLSTGLHCARSSMYNHNSSRNTIFTNRWSLLLVVVLLFLSKICRITFWVPPRTRWRSDADRAGYWGWWRARALLLGEQG